MNQRLDRLFAALELLGGGTLFWAACASDGGLALGPTVRSAALGICILCAGALGRALCSAGGRALRRRLAAMGKRRGPAAPRLQKYA